MDHNDNGRASLPEEISKASAEHYVWGSVCDGWHLLKNASLSVIQERVPPGAAEVGHLHVHAQQFFYVLAGAATLEFGNRHVTVMAGQGIHVPAGVAHRFVNRSDQPVEFLVISSPPTGSDRVLVDRTP